MKRFIVSLLALVTVVLTAVSAKAFDIQGPESGEMTPVENFKSFERENGEKYNGQLSIMDFRWENGTLLVSCPDFTVSAWRLIDGFGYKLDGNKLFLAYIFKDVDSTSIDEACVGPVSFSIPNVPKTNLEIYIAQTWNPGWEHVSWDRNFIGMCQLDMEKQANTRLLFSLMAEQGKDVLGVYNEWLYCDGQNNENVYVCRFDGQENVDGVTYDVFKYCDGETWNDSESKILAYVRDCGGNIYTLPAVSSVPEKLWKAASKDFVELDTKKEELVYSYAPEWNPVLTTVFDFVSDRYEVMTAYSGKYEREYINEKHFYFPEIFLNESKSLYWKGGIGTIGDAFGPYPMPIYGSSEKDSSVKMRLGYVRNLKNDACIYRNEELLAGSGIAGIGKTYVSDSDFMIDGNILKAVSPGHEIKVEIFDTAGLCTLEMTRMSNIALSIESLPKGIYLARMTDGHKVSTLRVIR